MIELNIAGDFFIPTSVSQDFFFGNEIINIFKNGDINIVNLESPVTEHVKNRIFKTGPNLKGNVNTFSFLKKLNINLLTLANNHIMDFGADGLSETIQKCEDQEIKYLGAGANITEANKYFNYRKEDINIAILNFAESEWSIAKKDKYGANPLNIIDNTRQIQEAKKDNDYVIVIIHGGHEYYQYPSPKIQNHYRFYAENGASLIIAHHTHCISGYEMYKKVPIFYSLGNFLFALPSDNNNWYLGLILKLKINKNENIKFELIPVKQLKRNYNLVLPNRKENAKILSEIEKYNTVIRDTALLENEWLKHISSLTDSYLNIFNPINFIKNIYIKAILKKIKLDKLFMKKSHYGNMLNAIRCESHYNLSKIIIENFITKK